MNHFQSHFQMLMMTQTICLPSFQSHLFDLCRYRCRGFRFYLVGELQRLVVPEIVELKIDYRTQCKS